MKTKRWLGILLTLAMLFSLTTPVYAVTGDLITNGDFEAGNTGFTTEYNYLNPSITGTWTLGPEYLYTIGTNPNLYHNAWTSFGDHTTGTGKMMIVNGTYLNNETKIFWSQEDISLPAPDPVVTVKKLFAGQDWEIGEVLIKNDEAGKICVMFKLTDPDAIAEGWIITQAHVAVAATCAEIPQTVKGNPIPGNFPVNETIDPGVTETDWFCLDYPWEAGEEICIAAHAKIELPEESENQPFCIYSGTDAMVGTSPATLAWVHPLWNSSLTMDMSPAQWIWNSNRTLQPVTGEFVEFTHDFPLIGTPLTGTLAITADNGFEASLNGTFLGDSTNLTAGWRTSDLTEAWVNTGAGVSSWATVRTFDVGALLGANNTLAVTGVNEQMDGGTIDNNPAGVIYKLCGTQCIITQQYDSETGWGEGTPFPGKNWATCMSYTPQAPTVDNYRFSMWARSSHPTAPGILQVEFDDVIKGTLSLTPDTSKWEELWFDIPVSAATSMDIILRDLRLIAFGDDFCIDDISLVKLP